MTYGFKELKHPHVFLINISFFCSKRTAYYPLSHQQIVLYEILIEKSLIPWNGLLYKDATRSSQPSKSYCNPIPSRWMYISKWALK